MSKVLVTGGAGFVGSNLCRDLLNGGDEVWCLDNFSTGHRENILPFRSNAKFHLIEGDVKQLTDSDLSFRHIYNLACPASPIHYQKDPVGTMMSSVLGTKNILELARVTGARVLQASTSEIYGNPNVSPQPETYFGNVNPTGLRACYDEGKRAAETLCFDYRRQHGVDVRVVRIFNTYGPGMAIDDGRAVSNFIVQALCNSPLIIYGRGAQTRSFMFVDDLVAGLKLTMSQEEIDTPINLGNPHEISINQLANLVLELLPESSSDIIHRASLSDDPIVRKPDINRAMRQLGWLPSVDLRDGLLMTINYFRRAMKE
ncbi:MAG: SDR family oxidoreductase [Candidatus Nomurabacteria bacterium]|jgi:UDP-glucuronate decarboxylase|nr:SDR family oxidoreductase [Candidatus Nomurabacteria bacterium]